jgi:hypothetical protein
MMDKFHSFVFIIAVTILHDMCYGFLIARYLGCNDQPGCIGPGTKITAFILSFPLNLVSWLWQKPRQPMTHWTFVLITLNAALFACILCFALNMLFKKRVGRVD